MPNPKSAFSLDTVFEREVPPESKRPIGYTRPRTVGKHLIGGKWVLKKKLNKEGKVERYKARYVAKGYSQKEGIDY